MEATTSDISSDILSLASWQRERTSAELHSFIERHHAALPSDIEIE